MYMRITEIWIRNYRLIRDMRIRDIERALILVGKNNTGKTAILDAVRVALGAGAVRTEDFQEDFSNIEISVRMSLEEEDLIRLHRGGRVSKYRRYEAWLEDFKRKLPSFQEGELSLYLRGQPGRARCAGRTDSVSTIPVLPRCFRPFMTLIFREISRGFRAACCFSRKMNSCGRCVSGSCMFDTTRQCSHCFSCIGLINQKPPGQLNVLEAARLLDYKLYQLNLDEFSRRVNRIFRKNGGQEEIRYSMNRDVERMLSVTAEIYHRKRKLLKPIESMGKGMRSIYMLSLLEACSMEDSFEPGDCAGGGAGNLSAPADAERIRGYSVPDFQEKPGDFFHPFPQSAAGFQFPPDPSDRSGGGRVSQRPPENGHQRDSGRSGLYGRRPDECGLCVYRGGGKQDKSRLPLLLKKYYAEVYDENGQLFRTAILTTNSCTNIKTYANLKYMNQIYLKDRFLMIRDGDGQDPRGAEDGSCAVITRSGAWRMWTGCPG